MSAATTKAFRSKLDKRLCGYLAPLIKHEALLRVPFFANTFPLAFHYASELALNKAPASLLDDRIQFISWAKETAQSVAPPRNPVVYYSTEDMAPNDDKSAFVCVTDFQPRWIFLEFNLTVYAERTRIAKSLGKPPETLEIEFRQISQTLRDFHFVEVFTEIPTQARALFTQILHGCWQDPNHPPTYLEPEKAHSILPMDDHLSKNTLRFFLYGAPLTSYFLRKRQRYIPFEVGKLGKARPSFRTVVVVRGGDRKIRKEILVALKEYHKILYRTAREEVSNDRLNFRAVQYNYNRIARLFQHRSSFPCSMDYAKCLHDHHKDPT